MHRALYRYDSTDEGALSFTENDTFTVIDTSNGPHWWLAQDGRGQIGYVPVSYLTKNEVM